MEIDEVHERCESLATLLAGTPVAEDMNAIVKDIEWAKTKVYIRKPAGKEWLDSIGRNAEEVAVAFEKTGGWDDTVQEIFDGLDDAVRRLRIEIARDTQTAT